MQQQAQQLQQQMDAAAANGRWADTHAMGGMGGRGGPQGEPDGSWTCPSCSNVNWPKRTTCNGKFCSAARPDMVAPSAGMVAPSGGYGGAMASSASGGYGAATTDATMGTQYGGSNYAAHVAAGEHPEGSWVCPKCQNVNWPKRSTCNGKQCGETRLTA
jgi:hypothetical protein